jgi:hypothetical protein
MRRVTLLRRGCSKGRQATPMDEESQRGLGTTGPGLELRDKCRVRPYAAGRRSAGRLRGEVSERCSSWIASPSFSGCLRPGQGAVRRCRQRDPASGRHLCVDLSTRLGRSHPAHMRFEQPMAAQCDRIGSTSTSLRRHHVVDHTRLPVHWEKNATDPAANGASARC